MTYIKQLYILLFASCFVLSSCDEQTIEDQVFGKLEGQVVLKGPNSPVANVKITTSPASSTVFTDIDGNFNIDDIAVGEYSIQADKTDLQTIFEPTIVYEGKTSNIVFEMDSISATNLVPLKSDLLTPLDKATGITNPVQFVWSSSQNDDDEITYTVELRNGETGDVQIFENVIDTTLTITDLQLGANYFWQVKSIDELNKSIQSNISSFQLQNNTDNRFLFVRNINGNNVIISGAEPVGTGDDDVDQNEVPLTSSNVNCYRPKVNRNINKIAYIRTIGGESHLFNMNIDGTDKKQITKDIPVAGFRQDEVEFAWFNKGEGIYYPNFNKLLAINLDGSGVRSIYETPSGEFISEIATNDSNNLVLIKTNNAAGYAVRLLIINPVNGQEVTIISEDKNGGYGGIDYSADGKKVLYTKDASEIENTPYRQLDSRIYEYTLADNSIREVKTDKPNGYNNLDAKYAPNEGKVIFTYTSNDGLSEKQIKRVNLEVDEDDDDTINSNDYEVELLFTNAYMPNWE